MNLNNNYILEYALKACQLSSYEVCHELKLSNEDWEKLLRYEYELNDEQCRALACMLDTGSGEIKFMTKRPDPKSKKLSLRFHAKAIQLLSWISKKL